MPRQRCRDGARQALLLLAAGCARPGAAMPPTLDGWDLDAYHNFIPAPNIAHNGSATLAVEPRLGISLNCSSALLSAAAERFTAATFAWPAAAATAAATPQQQLLAQGGGTLAHLSIEVGDADESAPQLGMDESYTLEIPATPNATATLRAPAVWGALRGLETLLQMIEHEPADGSYLLRYAPWSIADSPQLAHRGLLIDTARHWLPVSAIKRQIEAAAATKFNTVHWVRRAPAL